ncbi:MAG: oxidoreductase family protein [Chitinophagales bacterium]
MNSNFKNYLLKTTKASVCKEVEIIQELWSGYGKISRYKLSHSAFETVVVKNISLNEASNHPRGWNTDTSHLRKIKSYKVETNWYKNWNQLCNNNCSTPYFFGSYSEGKNQWLILEDLNRKYPLRKQEIGLAEVKVCLKWLANFHATFLNQKAKDLWQIGTYWHLETRPDEFEKIEHKELKEKAYLIDKKLNNCKYQTLVHGDAKLANFCFSETGKSVAAVDFQYVGAGCGIKDVAYFLGSCLSETDCEQYEKLLLDYYFSKLQEAVKQKIDIKELEEEWRNMYAYACADFTRFLLGWMPAHQKINKYNLKKVNFVLAKL